MHMKDHIQKNMLSSDPLIRELYTELDRRFDDLEKNKEVYVEKMKFVDSLSSILITLLISVYFLYVLFD